MTTKKDGLYLLLGVSFVVQATTSLIGGVIGIGPFTDAGNIAITMKNIANSINGVFIGIFLQIITSLVIVVLGAALFQVGKRINKTAALIAFGFYLIESIINIFNQTIVFALCGVSRLFSSNGDAALTTIGDLLSVSRDFSNAISMMPFGFGAILFYYLITRAGVIPKWLGLWGIIAVIFVLVGWTIEAFEVSVPFMLYIPYVPWEWVAGIYISTKGFKDIPNVSLHLTT